MSIPSLSSEKIAVIFDFNNLALRCFHTSDSWEYQTFASIYEFLMDACELYDSDKVDCFLAIDGPGGYWRKDIYQNYKADRAEKREKETEINYEALYESLRKFLDSCRNFLPWRVLQVERCEADDVIAVFCKTQKDYKQIVIHSADSDYVQLLDEKVSVFSPYKGYIQFPALVKVGSAACMIGSKQDFITVACMTGQGGKDNVYNIATPTDWQATETKKRKPPIGTKAALKVWEQASKQENILQEILTKKGMWGNYERNRLLIDLEQIPSVYAEKIFEAIKEERRRPAVADVVGFVSGYSWDISGDVTVLDNHCHIISDMADAERIYPEL